MFAFILNFRFALRQLWRARSFTVTAIVTLALGIGANAVVFSVLNAVVLHPVNVPHAQNLYMVQRFQYPSQSYEDYLDLRDRNRTFQGLIMYDIMGPVGVDTGENPSTAWPYAATGNYFDGLGIQPYLGRFFHASDEHGMNSVPFVVLSYEYWHGHFDDDATVVGRTIAINKHPLTIIGVAPPAFRGTELFFAPAMWIPMVEEPLIRSYASLGRGNHSGIVVGRLKPGVTPVQALDDLNSIGAWLSKTYPADDESVKFTLARPGLLGDLLGGPARAFMAGLMLLAGLILLSACANLGSLFAARTADLAKDTALRLALGSRRGLILSQMLMETVVVSLAGGALGLAGGISLLHLLNGWQPIPDIPINIPVNPDAATYGVALLLALGSGLLFGLVPARQVMRSDPWQVIRTGMSGAASHRRFTVRDVLLAVQVAICAVLVTSSLVAVRGLLRSVHSSFGFVPQNVTLVGTDLNLASYTEDRLPQTQQRMMDAAAAIPGVTSVGYTSNLPLTLSGGDSGVFTDSTTDFRPSNGAADAMNYNVSPGYMATAGTRMLAGRDLSPLDNMKSPKVALVNRQFAMKVFGSVDKAIGGHFKYWNGQRAEVVGVVEDGKYRSLTEDQWPAMFFSFRQQHSSDTWLLVRSNRNPDEIARALQTAIHQMDPALPIVVRTWNEEMSTALFAPRVATVALGVLGLLGVMLAITGVFGLASYTVSKRMREIGIRMALGAKPTSVLRAALARPFMLLTIGSTAGLALGLLATKVLSYIVYQAGPKDPLVLGGVVLTMLSLGLVAAWIPASKALHVDPVILLREE